MAYGVTDEGFVRKDLQTILEEIKSNIKSQWGDDTDVSTDSNFGQWAAQQAARENSLWELAEEVYNARNPDNAEGIGLDRVAALIASERLEATATTVTATLYGDNSTVVAAGKQASKSETEELFSLDTTTTISKADATYIELEITTVVDSTLYTITINGNGYTYTSGTSATAAQIMAGLVAAIGGAEPLTISDNLDGTATFTADDFLTAFSFVEDGNMTINEVGTNATFTADIKAATSLPTNSLINIVTPVTGWNSVNNNVAGDTGRDVETDEEFRIRLRENQRSAGGGTEEAITARLLEDVANVTDVLLTSNRTNSTDAESRPAKSFEAVVVGGTDADVAEMIWLTQPAGIESYGNTTETVVDSEGRNQTVKFSRPENKYLWVTVDVSVYSEEELSSNYTDDIKEAIVEFGEEEYTIGKNVILNRLFTPVNTVPGLTINSITTAVTATAGTPPGSYDSSDISISDREIAVAATARITVNLT